MDCDSEETDHDQDDENEASEDARECRKRNTDRNRVVPGPRGSLACQNVTCFVSHKNFKLTSQIRVVSRNALKVFHQQHANFAEPMLGGKHISSLIEMLCIGNVRPWSNARKMFDRSDV
jgi:hypothetical protein